METRLALFTALCVGYIFGLLGYVNHRDHTRDLEKALRSEISFKMSDTLSQSLRKGSFNLAQAAVASAREAAPVLADLVDYDPTIYRVIRNTNWDLSDREAKQLAYDLEQAARRYNVDPLLLTALVRQESAFYADAVSPVGAVGYGQLMPATAADMGIDPTSPEQNLDGAARYLSWQLATWAGLPNQVDLALASYNAGAGAVQKYGGVPPYQETQNYVATITGDYYQMVGLSAQNSGRTARV